MKYSFVQLVIEPDYVQTWTTEMPLQTPGPKEEVDDTGQPSRSHLIPAVFFSVVLILAVGGIAVCSIKSNLQKQQSSCKNLDFLLGKKL